MYHDASLTDSLPCYDVTGRGAVREREASGAVVTLGGATDDDYGDGVDHNSAEETAKRRAAAAVAAEDGGGGGGGGRMPTPPPPAPPWPGYADGTGTVARFNYPVGIACLPEAPYDCVVADYSNHRIRLVAKVGASRSGSSSSSSGVISGAGSNGSGGGGGGGGGSSSSSGGGGGGGAASIVQRGEITTLSGSVQGYADGPLESSKFVGLVDAPQTT